MKTWNDLSIREKSAMMRTAIRNGITTLPEIKKAYNEFAEGGPTVEGGELPEVVVTGYKPIELNTYYPVISEFPYTGHSELIVPYKGDNPYTTYQSVTFNKGGDTPGYNLITNNCSDLTLNALNEMFGTSFSPNFFTTPGDVQDYALKYLNGYKGEYKDGVQKVYIPRSEENYEAINKAISSIKAQAKNGNTDYTGIIGSTEKGINYDLLPSLLNEVSSLQHNIDSLSLETDKINEKFSKEGLTMPYEEGKKLLDKRNKIIEKELKPIYLERDSIINDIEENYPWMLYTEDLKNIIGIDPSTVNFRRNKNAMGGPLVKTANKYAMGGPENDLVDRVIQEEEFLAKPTNIGDGKMTLGSGLTASKWHKLYNQKGEWTEEDNQKAVAEELEERRKWAEKDVPNWDKLPQDSQNALLSYKYNFDFNRKNSPKLYKALSEGDYEEAARQINATSKNPKFKKGLMARRQREQEWFLKGLEQVAKEAETPVEQVVENVSVYNPPQSVIDNIIANNGKYMITGTPPLAGTKVPVSGIADGLAMQDRMAKIWQWIKDFDMLNGLIP